MSGVEKKHWLADEGVGWKGAVPYSLKFNDIYFSPVDGKAEASHVFLKGNDLPDRLASRSSFHILELGFGTGMNFVVTVEAMRQEVARKKSGVAPILHYTSIEAFPLSSDSIKKALSFWPDSSDITNELAEYLPVPVRGGHRISFRHMHGSVFLTLIYSDVLAALSQIEGCFDALYLDGFAPAKNPAMWSTEVMQQLARLAAPNCTLATFTSAGVVRRNLEKVGFSVEKVPGFGKKREMIRGWLKNGNAK